jgi:integrase
MPLTDTQIRNAKSDGQRKRLYDERGLYLELAPSGGKWWRLKYRFEGKEKLLSMGTYPDVPLAGRWVDKDKQKARDPSGYLKGARDYRDEARELLAMGIDPSAERKAAKHARRERALHTFESVARDWLSHRASAWKPGTRAAIQSSLQTHAFPKLGARPIGEIQPGEVRDIVKAIEAAGASETAARVFQRIQAVFRYAIAHDVTTNDPTYPLKPSEIFKPRKVVHRAALAEADVPEFLRRLEAYDGDAATKGALELLMLTAVRPGELRGARWDEVDEARKVWRIDGQRMKMKTPHIVPLSKQALAVLASLKSLGGGVELVFPSPFYPGKPISDGTLNSALARLGYKGMATAHGFRTLFSTCANEGGWEGDVIEKQLAHEERDEVRGAYNRAQYLQQRTKLMQWWGDHLDELHMKALARKPTESSVPSGLARS